MKKYLLLLFIVSTHLLSAQSFNNAYEQLVSVNEQWKNQNDIDPALKSTPAKPFTEQQLVQFHLQQTELMLRKRNASHLSIAQQKLRENNLNTLHKYWNNGIFPINDLHQNRQPYFIDKFNTYCAVGYLMKMTGADAIAREIHDKQNYSYLFDINHPQLMDWASKSGLTLGELALIQPGYGDTWPASLTEIHYNNIGTDVNEYIEFHQFHGSGVGGVADSLLFYDETGLIYKRLAVSSMQLFIKFGHPFHYYIFPANEHFADKGKVEMRGMFYVVYATLQTITYDSTSISITNFSPSIAIPTAQTYTVGENESTAIGSSINFCGGNMIQSPATVGTDASCLNLSAPITLSKFDYSINNKKVNLSWETVSEINNNYFAIEKSSDGINFQAIGKVNGAGTSNSIKQYSFVDDKPAYINQYRLKQVDFDGKFTTSKILFVKVQMANPLSIVSNPVKKQLQVQVNLETAKAGSLSIFDFMGRKIKTFNAINGLQNLDVQTLTTGKYLLQLTTKEGQAFNQQFIKAE